MYDTRTKSGPVTLEEWRVPVGEVVITPTVMQQTIHRWIHNMGKSPAAIAQALGIGTGALSSWLKNSRTIPKNRINKFCETARNAAKLPAATKKEIEIMALDAQTGTDKPAPRPMVTGHWPRLIRLFLRLKKRKTTGTVLQRLTGIDKDQISRWKVKGCESVMPKTADRLDAACEKHREWKRAQKGETAAMAKKTNKKPPLMETLRETVLNAVPNADAQVSAVASAARDEVSMAADVVTMRHIAAEAIERHDQTLRAAKNVAEENEQMREELRLRRTQVDTLVAQIEEKQNQLEKTQKENEKLMKTLGDSEAAQAAAEAANAELKKAKAEIKELTDALNDAVEQVRTARAEAKQVEADRFALHAETDAIIKDLTAKLEAAQNTDGPAAEKLNVEISNLRALNKVAMSGNERLSGQLTAAQQENAELKAENDRLMTELENAEIRAAEAENRPAPARTESTDTEALQKQIDRLSDALTAVTAKYNEDCDVFRAMFMQQYRSGATA